MLFDAELGKNFWAEACNTANYIINRSPTKALEHGTSYESWFSLKPVLSHLHYFGYNAYLHLPPVKRTDLQSKTRCCIMLSYVHDTTKLWRLWDSVQKNIINATNVDFDEDFNTASKKLAEQATPKVMALLALTPTNELYSQTQCEKAEELMHLNAIEEPLPDNISISSEDGIGDTIVVQPLPPEPRR